MLVPSREVALFEDKKGSFLVLGNSLTVCTGWLTATTDGIGWSLDSFQETTSILSMALLLFIFYSASFAFIRRFAGECWPGLALTRPDSRSTSSTTSSD